MHYVCVYSHSMINNNQLNENNNPKLDTFIVFYRCRIQDNVRRRHRNPSGDGSGVTRNV